MFENFVGERCVEEDYFGETQKSSLFQWGKLGGSGREEKLTSIEIVFGQQRYHFSKSKRQPFKKVLDFDEG